jgi:type IV secretory pathway ATPase VirB11/archaellum biosynthesis ATPase
VAEISPNPGRWAFRPIPPEPRSIVELIGARVLDAELAATLWLLVEGRVPVVVAAQARGAGKTTLLNALLTFLPPGVRLVELVGDGEDFAWPAGLSSAGRVARSRHRSGCRPVRPDTTVLLVAELSDHLPAYTWGAAARIAVRATSIGYGLAATIHADGLDEVFDLLSRPPNLLTDDELSHLGVVLILRRIDRDRRRVVAAHYVRPVARDGHGHVQRLGPAVLSTWDPAMDAFEGFAWGITPELALRVGRRAGDFEVEADRRARLPRDLLRAGTTSADAVRRALRSYVPLD